MFSLHSSLSDIPLTKRNTKLIKIIQQRKCKTQRNMYGCFVVFLNMCLSWPQTSFKAKITMANLDCYDLQQIWSRFDQILSLEASCWLPLTSHGAGSPPPMDSSHSLLFAWCIPSSTYLRCAHVRQLRKCGITLWFCIKSSSEEPGKTVVWGFESHCSNRAECWSGWWDPPPTVGPLADN